MSNVRRTTLHTCWQTRGQRVATPDLAGPALADALAVCRAVAEQGVASTVGFRNRDESPREVADTYRAALDTLATARLDCSLSMREGFLDLVKRLAGRARVVVVATHDTSLAALALGRLHAAGTPCRLELLFGLPVRRLLQLARLVGVAVRLYVPYGHAFLPYRRSQCTVRPAIASWAARDVLRGRSPWPAATAAAKG